MSTTDEHTAADVSERDLSLDVCANCGKGEDLKACTACKLVKYCNRDCQIAHRPQHKKACRKRAAELHEEKLFKEPPTQHGDCPICFLRLPIMGSGRKYMSCCGKMICSGCCHADAMRNIKEQKCPFCRTPVPNSDEEILERNKKCMAIGDEHAFFLIGRYYSGGHYGFPQNRAKALELWRKAGKFGYNNLGSVYDNGEGVERDEKMASHYFELSAMAGDVTARCNLGITEENAGNYDRALKHYMIAVRGGDTPSVKEIQEMYMNGHATKDHYANALRSHQVYLNEIKSDQRDTAAVFDAIEYKYY